LQKKEENAKDDETKTNTNKPTNQPKQDFPPACQFLSLAILAQNQNDELLSTSILGMHFFPQELVLFNFTVWDLFIQFICINGSIWQYDIDIKKGQLSIIRRDTVPLIVNFRYSTAKFS